ncbi:MAG: 50S ribosomal protein L25 [Candidatus Moranbacteria bacterium GW2011_GWF2_37_7]|nr:MAG: 50S ribosomal protein L25 [Candidatus Moranbacteria bacterium GW2011_GWF2_37_7]
MLELQISAKIRDKFGKQTKALKKNGVIPAVLYGHGSEATALSLDLKEFAKIYKQAGESTIINLNIERDGKAELKPVLIHEVDFDPVSDQLRHADFYVVKMDEKITAKIPLVFIGESNAVKVLNGILIKNLHEIEIEALPKDLPHQIDNQGDYL